MRSVFQYIRPNSLEDAAEWLREKGADTIIFAGGTDLMPAIRKGDISCKYVMDVSRLRELKEIGFDHGSLVIGAAVTYTELLESPIISEHAPVISYAARCVGSEQIRNVGTLGGNVGNASPAADSIPALLVHNAYIELVSSGEFVKKPLEEIILGPYRTSLKRGDLITKFHLEALPLPYRAVYRRIGRRRAMSIARINLAAVATMDSSGVVSDLRLSIGSMTPQPYRATSVERIFVGRKPELAHVTEAAALATQEMIKLSGIRPSSQYKKPAAEGLIILSLCKLFEIPINEGTVQ